MLGMRYDCLLHCLPGDLQHGGQHVLVPQWLGGRPSWSVLYGLLSSGMLAMLEQLSLV